MSVGEAWQEVRNLQAIEAELEQVDVDERRARSYFFGRMFAPQFDLPTDEIIGAILRVRAELPGDWAGRVEVADDVAPSDMPVLSEALREALAGSTQDDPGEDLLWIQLVIGLTYDRFS
jgi:hypothetical protein